MSQNASIKRAESSGNYFIATEWFELCVDRYVDLISEGWESTPLEVQTGRSGLAAQTWKIGPCMLSSLEVGPFMSQKKPTHRETIGSLVVLEKYTAGFEIYDNGRCYSAGPIRVLDEMRSARSINTALKAEEIYIPKDMVGLSPTRPARYAAIYEHSMIGNMVHAEWRSLFKAAESGQSEIAKHVIERFAASVKIAFGVHPQREDVRAQARELLRRQIQRYINANLVSPELSPRTILERFGVSRPSLYRMFQPFGGIRSYITNMRAHRALLEIRDAGSTRGSVSAARERWQFATGNDFNRTIRRLFGNSPRRLLSRRALDQRSKLPPAMFTQDFLEKRWG